MRILAFDTATPATTVALTGFGPGGVQARDDPAPGERPGHVTRLLPLIAEVLDRAGAGWRELDRLAVGTGPGTFTGLRIGIATARALALAAELPLVGVSTLQSLAWPALGATVTGRQGLGIPAGCDVVLAVLDARRGEAFASAWKLRSDGPPVRVLAPAALTPQALSARAQELGGGALAVGDGALAFRGLLERSGAFVPPDASDLHRVNAAVHAELARELPVTGPFDVSPEYIRLPDAEIARRAAR